LVEADKAFVGLPMSRHEAACASGSMAVLAGMADIESGRYDAVIVVGVEEMRSRPGAEAAQMLGTAAWVPHETAGVEFPWPQLFSDLSDEYDRRYGLDRTHLSAIAQSEFANAKYNPNAQTRDWRWDESSFVADDETNPVVSGWIRKQDCSQITDGGAGVVLASRSFAERWAARHGVDLNQVPRIAGWGHTSARMALNSKLADSRADELIFPHVSRAIQDALGRAEISDVAQLDLIEMHDCFTITQYMAIDHFGITDPGQSFRAVEDGTILRTGSLPMNPSGGLMGGGHPVGATGVRMLLDATRQVSGRAGDYQVGDAKRAATLNIGGSATTVASFVVETR
jgi:acetyl-CoA C-acetyltransferase